MEQTSSFSSGDESGIHEIYINDSLQVISKNILYYNSIPNSSGNSSIFQINKILNKYDEESTVQISLDNDDNVVIGGLTDKIVIKDIDGSSNLFLTQGGNSFYLYVEDYQELKNYVALSTISFQYKISKSLDKKTNYFLGSILFENFNGKISGSEEFSPNLKRSFGNISEENMSESFLENYFEEYRHLNNGNAVVYGCQVHSPQDDGSLNYKFEIESGEVFISGRKIEVVGKEYETEIPFSATSDRIYVGVDENGKILFESSNSSGCACSFDLRKVLLISVINYSVSYGFEANDLRIFLNEENISRIGTIYINSDKSKRNFRTINDAVKYAKNISNLSKNFGTPTIKFLPGKHECLVYSVFLSTLDSYVSSTYRTMSENYDNGLYLDFQL